MENKQAYLSSLTEQEIFYRPFADDPSIIAVFEKKTGRLVGGFDKDVFLENLDKQDALNELQKSIPAMIETVKSFLDEKGPK